MRQESDFCHGGVCIPPGTDVICPVMPIWCGHQRTSESSYDWNGMRRGGREMVLWQYTISGCGAVNIDGKTLPVRPGEAFLLSVPEKHRYYLPETSGHWEFLYLGLEGAVAKDITDNVRRRHGSVSAAYAGKESVGCVWELVRANLEKKVHAAEMSAIAYRFLMMLNIESEQDCREQGNDLLRKLHLYILANLAKDISLEDMADFSGCSRSHFCRIFQHQTGKGAHEYLLEIRMNMALRLLQYENLSVKETAAACGFAESGYFCKVFRKYHGSSPGSFRRMTKIKEI